VINGTFSANIVRHVQHMSAAQRSGARSEAGRKQSVYYKPVSMV